MNIAFVLGLAALVLALSYLSTQSNWTNEDLANQPTVNYLADSMTSWYWSVDQNPAYYSGATQNVRLMNLTGDTSKTTYNLAIGNTLINSWLVITYATATNPTSLLTSLRFRLANLSNVYVAVNNNCVLSYLNYVPSIQMEILNNMFSAVCDGNQLLNNVVLVPLNESI